MAHPEMLDAPVPSLRERIEAYGKLPTNLPYEDGVPLESDWHRDAMSLLIDVIRHHWRDRTDFFVGGNMFVYFDPAQARSRNFRGPDFFVATGVTDPKRERKSWVVWEEGFRVPDLVIELASESTKREDLGPKKKAYGEELGVPNYVVYDPETKSIRGWRLQGTRYEPIAVGADGRVWLDAVKMSIGLWHGSYGDLQRTWLRFFDPAGELALTKAEAEAFGRLAEKARADAATTRAEAEKARADAEVVARRAEKARADAAILQAQAEKARADALAAELERIRRGGK